VKRIKLSFVAGVEVEFADRESAIKQFEELAEKGTRFPIVAPQSLPIHEQSR